MLHHSIAILQALDDLRRLITEGTPKLSIVQSYSKEFPSESKARAFLRAQGMTDHNGIWRSADGLKGGHIGVHPTRYKSAYVATVDTLKPDEDEQQPAARETRQQSEKTKRSSGKTYEYGLALRPFGMSSVPEGWIDTKQDPRFRHGVVVYDRKLSTDEVRHFDLVWLPAVKDEAAIVDEIARKIEDPEEMIELFDVSPNDASLIVMETIKESFPFFMLSGNNKEITKRVIDALRSLTR